MASVVGNSITSSAAKGVFKTVTCQYMIFHSCCPTLYLIQKIAVDGHAFTIITSKGGEGFTLAPSGVGVVTTVLGSVYTVATGATSIATSTPTSSSSNSESAPDAPKLDPYRVLAIFAGAFVIIFIILTILERFDKRPCQYCD